MTAPDHRPWGGSLPARILTFTMASYLALIALNLLLWNFGLPHLGTKGRIAELLDLETEYITTTISAAQSRCATWMAARAQEAQALARLESSDSRIDELARKAVPESAQLEARRYFEERYAATCRLSPNVTRILVLGPDHGEIIVDSQGLMGGEAFALVDRIGSPASGQFRFQGDIYSYASGVSPAGSRIVFLLVAPIAPLVTSFVDERLDTAKNLATGIAGHDGQLLTALSVPETDLSYGVGEVPLERDTLARLAEDGVPKVVSRYGERVAVGALAVVVAENDTLFLVAMTSRDKTVSSIVASSAVMAVSALLFAVLASVFAWRYIVRAFVPLERLRAAVETYGRSGLSRMPEDSPGEVGEITRAFAGLVQRVGAWTDRLETEVETRTAMLRLTAELCGIYAKDESEQANVHAANLLKESFKAEVAALFYVNGAGGHRFCMAGTEFPIAVPAERWRDSVRGHMVHGTVARFGPWSPPGFEASLPLWMSYRLYGSKSEGGYIFLGRSEGEWSDTEEADLKTLVQAIAPIVRVRHERELEEIGKREAQEKLASNEKRLRTFLEGSRDMIYIADSDDRVTWVNAAGLAVLGLRDKDDLVGKPCASFAMNQGDRELLLRKVRESGYAADYEIILRKSDGSSVFCLETAYAIRDSEGQVIELQGIVKDISERISSESALWKSNIELADANLKIQKAQTLMIQHEKLASIGQLAAGVAHEINNPLGFLKSNHQMLEKYLRTIRQAWDEVKAAPHQGVEEIERKKNLAYLFSQIETIFEESDEGFARIMHIVGNLKNFSRIDQGADFEPYDVNSGIENTLIVARNEIKYVADVKKDLGELPTILARGSEINQVLLNILVNAAQAIEGQKRKDKGIIEIRTIAMGDRVVIGIRDDGPGIPESIRLKIFDPFFTTKEPGKGTGLGLSISYDIIVSKHGGRISVDSSPGGGTTFTIELPVKPPAKTEA